MMATSRSPGAICAKKHSRSARAGCSGQRRNLIMPGNPRAIIAEAERAFPVRIVIRVPPNGIGARYMPMTEWLDVECGVGGRSITPTGTRGIANDAIAIYMSGPTCAVAFVARWCVGGDPPGLYELRQDEPARRVSSVGLSSPRQG